MLDALSDSMSFWRALFQRRSDDCRSLAFVVQVWMNDSDQQDSRAGENSQNTQQPGGQDTHRRSVLCCVLLRSSDASIHKLQPVCLCAAPLIAAVGGCPMELVIVCAFVVTDNVVLFQR